MTIQNNQTQTHNISHLGDLDKLSKKFISNLSDKEVILLQGPLGIGKSEWVRLCLKNLGYKKNTPSPSFALHHSYQVNDRPVDHIDLYRLKKDEELASIDFQDLFRKKKGIIFIEWADRLNLKKLPSDWKKTLFIFKWSQDQRFLTIRNTLN